MYGRDRTRFKTSESFFRDMLEMAPDAMVLVDHSGRILVVNSQVERMFGYLREEMYGRVDSVVRSEDKDAHPSLPTKRSKGQPTPSGAPSDMSKI